MSSKANMGKWAEKEVQTWLTHKSNSTTDLAWHRFPDARAARGALAAQPSDLLVVYKDEVVFVEVKETAEARRLPKGKVSQWGVLKKFWWSGASVLVVVFMSAEGKWVLLDPLTLGMDSDDDCPASFPLSNLRRFDTAADLLEEYFK